MLNVSGPVTLAGTLNALSFGGYVASVGDSLNFLNVSSLGGVFASVNSPAFNSALTYGLKGISLAASPFTVVPQVMPPAPPIDPTLLVSLNFSKLPNAGSGDNSLGDFNALLQLAPTALIGGELNLGGSLSGEARDARLLCN